MKRLSGRMTTILIDESNKIDDPFYPKGNKGSFSAWAWLLEQKKLTHDVIKELQARITQHQTDLFSDEKGQYRQIDVWIGDRKGADPKLVVPFMDNWLLDYKNLDPKDAHVRFEKIHPFVDGNGRTGRMIMWWQQLQKGEEPTLIAKDEVKKYYKWLTS